MSITLLITKVEIDGGATVITAQVVAPLIHLDNIPKEQRQEAKERHDARSVLYLGLHLGTAQLEQQPIEPGAIFEEFPEEQP